MADWTVLLGVQAGAAATLMGLVFVAVSINLARIMSVPGLPGRAAESIMQLLTVFFISTAGLIPGQPIKVAGAEFLFIGTIFWIGQLTTQIRYLRARRQSGHPLIWLIDRVVLSLLATIPYCVAGVMLLCGVCGGQYWLVPGFFFSFSASVVSAWVLLVEIHR